MLAVGSEIGTHWHGDDRECCVRACLSVSVLDSPCRVQLAWLAWLALAGDLVDVTEALNASVHRYSAFFFKNFAYKFVGKWHKDTLN